MMKNVLIASILTLTVIMGAYSEDKPSPPNSDRPVFAQVFTSAELLDAVSRIGKKGGTIVLLPGTYEIKDTIVIKHSGVMIMGSGWNTVIKKIGDGNAIEFVGSLYNCGVRNIVVEGDYNAKSGSGIVFKEGEWSGINMIDYCYLRFFADSGIRFEGIKDKPFSSNTISNCWIQGNHGEQLYSSHNNDFLIFGNQIGRGPDGKFPRVGVVLDNSSAGTYSMNYHWSNITAIKIFNSNFNRYENNRIENSRESGVIIGDKDKKSWNMYNIFVGNTIHTNSEDKFGGYSAIVAYDMNETTFTSNQFFSWSSDTIKHKNAMELYRCNNWIIKDNIFRHHTESAVIYDKKAGHIIKDNIKDPDVKLPKADKK